MYSVFAWHISEVCYYSLLALIHPGPRAHGRGVLWRGGLLSLNQPGVYYGGASFFFFHCAKTVEQGQVGQVVWIQNATRPDKSRETSPQIGLDRLFDAYRNPTWQNI